MNDRERRMNRYDLEDYSSDVKAMIPGIHNLPTVGTSPLKRGLKREDHDRQQAIMLERDPNKTKHEIDKLPSLAGQAANISALSGVLGSPSKSVSLEPRMSGHHTSTVGNRALPGNFISGSPGGYSSSTRLPGKIEQDYLSRHKNP